MVDTGRIMFPFSGERPAFDFGLFSEVEAEVIAVEGGGNKWDDETFEVVVVLKVYS